MWATLALATVMNVAPAQLELKNVRTTYGVLGQERKDEEFLPGDVVVVAFDVDGFKVKDDGRVLYAMGLELTKKGKAKPEYKRDPQDLEALNSLGGTSLPLIAIAVIGTDAAPGDYSVKVTVRDRQVKGSEKVLEKNFKVKKPEFGFVKIRLLSSTGQEVPNIGVPGQRIHLLLTLVNFDLGKDKLPDMTFEMQILDAAGKPTVKNPFTGPLKEDVSKTPGQMELQPIQIDLNRAGKFKVMLKATCNHSKKTAEQTLDLEVVGAK